MTQASAQTITFEEVAVSSPPPAIGVRYSNQGVLLPKTSRIIQLPQYHFVGKARSPSHVLISADFADEFDPRPLDMLLTQAVQSVIVYVGMPGYTWQVPVEIQLTAFDSQGNQVDSARVTVMGPTDVGAGLRVTAPQMAHIISKIRVEATQSDASPFEFIDDLTFKAESPPPILATEPPQVYISSPTASSTTTDGQLSLSGKIIGTGLFPEYAPPEVTILFPIEPGSGTPTGHLELELNKDLFWLPPGPPGAPGLSFSVPLQLTHLGKNTLTVMASNAAGSGSAQTSIYFLPANIEAEFTKRGGYSTFGGFKWSDKRNGCLVAIYQKGAIFSSPAGTYSSIGKIFKKWKTVKTVLMCAVGPHKSLSSGVSQDFAGGRVYSGSPGTYYVIEPFVDAIDRLDFVTRFGMPVSDPVKQQLILRPLLWQKFRRSYDGVPLISTMEVTDNPLTLWVANPDVEGAQRAGVQKITERIPTAWRSFKCNQPGEPCVGLGPPKSTMGLWYSKLKNACGFGHYPFWGTPAWPLLSAPMTIVPFSGNVKSSALSNDDAPWNHDCSTGLFGGVDWIIRAVPDPGFEHLLGGDGSDISEGRVIHPNYRQEILEIEYEYCLVGFPPPSNQGAHFQPGDRVYVAGRWISDCGCHPWTSCSSPYRSEIHPPAIMMDIFTEQRLGQPATIGEIIYLDWWYPGQMVDLDIFPPPRPNATDVLSVAVPMWMGLCPSGPGASGHCGYSYSFEPGGAFNHLRLTFTGRPDVLFHTPPKEDWDGQLHHGYAKPVGPNRPVPPSNLAHRKSLWGEFEVGWSSN